MLSSQSIATALPLAQALDARGFAVQAQTGSPLSELFRASNAEDFPLSIANADSARDLQAWSDLSTPGQYGTHSQVCDLYVDQITKTVTELLAFTRGVVIPDIKDYIERVEAVKKSLAASSLLGLAIDVRDAPSVVLSPAFAEVIKGYEGVELKDSNVVLSLPEADDQFLIESARTGLRSIDEQVLEWIDDGGLGYLRHVYENILRQGTQSLLSHYNSRDEGLDVTLAAYLLARSLAVNIPEGAQGSLGDVTRELAIVRDLAGARLALYLRYIDQDLRNKVLVLGVTDKVVRVNPLVYKDWQVDNNERNEILLGLLVSGGRERRVEDIEAKADYFLKQWQSEQRIAVQVEANDRSNRLRQIYRQVFEALVSDDVENNVQAAPQAAAQIKVANEIIDGLLDPQLADVQEVACKVVGGAKYAHTDAVLLIDLIDAASSANPEINAREAAAIATIEYIAQWVSDQFVVTDAR